MKTPPSFPIPPLHLDFSHRPCGQPHDEVLMSAIQERDPHALDLLFQRYRLLLKSVILRIVHDHASADDVMQESILEIWRHADHYSAAKGRPLGWIITVGKRRAIDHVRRHQAYSQARERMRDGSGADATADVQDASSHCEQAELGRVLREHLSLLPPPQQQVIRLAFLKGMSQREVAQATQTPLGTVKTRMDLGLKKLRAAFRSSENSHAHRTLQHA